MEKDYDGWNIKKQGINLNAAAPQFNEGEIWHCHMGINIGFEADGKKNNFLRPIFILKRFNQHTFWALPLTHMGKSNIYYHQPQHDSLGYLNLSQLRLMDARRLVRRKVKIAPKEVEEIKEKVRNLIS